jgi:hypothetical protein
VERLEADYDRGLWTGLTRRQLERAAGHVGAPGAGGGPTGQVPTAVLRRGLRLLRDDGALPLTSVECDAVVASLRTPGAGKVGWVDVRRFLALFADFPSAARGAGPAVDGARRTRFAAQGKERAEIPNSRAGAKRRPRREGK